MNDRRATRIRAKAAASAIAIVALAPLAGIACTPGQDPAQVPGAEPLRRASLSVLQLLDPFVPADAFNKPAVGTRYVGIKITIGNTSGAELTVEPARWIKARTRNGATIDAAVITAQPDDISAGGANRGRLPAGGELSGLLIYEIPAGDGVNALLWHDDLEPRQAGEVQVA